MPDFTARSPRDFHAIFAGTISFDSNAHSDRSQQQRRTANGERRTTTTNERRRTNDDEQRRQQPTNEVFRSSKFDAAE